MIKPMKCKISRAGYWSDRAHCPKFVTVTSICVSYLDGSTLLNSKYGELLAYFDKKEWDVDRWGLIYPDEGWMKDVRVHLRAIGFSEEAVKNVSYSEYGMQGDTFVSMDIGSQFIAELDPLMLFLKQKDQISKVITINYDSFSRDWPG